MIDAQRDEAAVGHLCALFSVAPSGYYRWCDQSRRTQREMRDTNELAAIRRIFVESNETYGSPRIHAALRQAGYCVNRKRVARLMHLHAIVPHPTKRFRSLSKRAPERSAAPNLLQQTLVASAPNRVWLVDSTEFATYEGKLYLAVVEDLFSRRIVSWQTHHRFNTELVCTTLRLALAHAVPLHVHSLIHHSDQGSQYTSTPYTTLLAAHHIHSSMSDVGNCYDNAPIESFFATLKKEWTTGFVWHTRQQLTDELAAFIDGFYNPQRLHSALGFLAPNDFERSYYAQQKQQRRQEDEPQSLHPDESFASPV